MGYIQIAILVSTFLLGGLSGYTIEHQQVLIMEGRLKDQKIEAANILSKEVERVSSLETTQRNLNIELDKTHEQLTTTSKAYASKQHDVINSLSFTDGRKGGCSSTSESTNTSIHPTDEEEFTWVSRKLLNYLAAESRRAEEDAIDKNTLIAFTVDQNCGVPK